MVIGREDADITIEDQEISRRHAELRPAGDSIEIEDLGSTNGTFVNEERITAARTLAPGDVVRVGKSEFEMERPPAGGTVVAASPSGGTSISQQPPAKDDAIPSSAATGTSAGAPPSVESWSPAPTGAGPGGPSQPPASAYTPPPSSGYGTGQGYVGQQGYGSGYPTGGAGQYGGGQSPGSYGASDKKGGKAPLIAAIAGVIVLALIAVALFVWPGFLRQSEEDKVREVVTEFGQRFGDPSICDLVTQRFLDEASGLTGEEAVEACRTDVEAGDDEPVEVEIKSVEIEGDRATVEAEARGESGTFELEKQDDGEWLIDDSY